MPEFSTYRVFVMDPKHPDRAAGFTIRAVSPQHAERQAKDGYTGLLGGAAMEQTQARLVLSVTAA